MVLYMLQLLKRNEMKIQKERNITMIVKTTIPPDAHELYERAKASEPVSFPKLSVITPINVDDLMASPAMERLAKSLAKLYIETEGMK